MSVMTINTATQIGLIGVKQPIRLGLRALWLVGSGRVDTGRIGSPVTRSGLVDFSLSLRRKKISCPLL